MNPNYETVENETKNIANKYENNAPHISYILYLFKWVFVEYPVVCFINSFIICL